jgi:WD40 repeat protein
MKHQRVILFTGLIILWGAHSGFSQTFPEIIWDKQAQGSNSELASTDSIRFSADGQRVFAGGSQRGGSEVGSITTFAAKDGTVLGLTPTYFQIYGINELALSPDGLRIATAHNGVSCTSPLQDECRYAYILYDALNLNIVSQPLTSFHPASSVDYSPNGQLVAVGDYSPSDNIKLLHANDFSIAGTLPGHTRAPGNGRTRSVRFSPNGELLASGGADDTVKIWRVADGSLVQTLFYGSSNMEILSVEFSPDGHLIAAADGDNLSKIRIWDVQSGTLVRTFENPYFDSTVSNTVRWTPDGQYVVNAVVSGFDPSQIHFWNLKTGGLARTYLGANVNTAIRTLEFAPDGSTFAFSHGSHVILARNPFAPGKGKR